MRNICFTWLRFGWVAYMLLLMGLGFGGSLAMAAPVLSKFPDVSIDEDHSTPLLEFTVQDPSFAPSDLALSVSSSNLALVSAGKMVLGGSGTNRTLMVFPNENGFGESLITIAAKSPDGRIVQESFRLQVRPVNDPPKISDIPGQLNGVEDIATSIRFTISDVDTPIRPVLRGKGTATIVLTASDGLASTELALPVRVLPSLSERPILELVGTTAGENLDLRLTGIPTLLLERSTDLKTWHQVFFATPTVYEGSIKVGVPIVKDLPGVFYRAVAK